MSSWQVNTLPKLVIMSLKHREPHEWVCSMKHWRDYLSGSSGAKLKSTSRSSGSTTSSSVLLISLKQVWSRSGRLRRKTTKSKITKMRRKIVYRRKQNENCFRLFVNLYNLILHINTRHAPITPSSLKYSMDCSPGWRNKLSKVGTNTRHWRISRRIVLYMSSRGPNLVPITINRMRIQSRIWYAETK